MVAHEVHSNSRYAIEEAFQRPAEVAREYPITSMLVVFGVGLGVGVMLGQVACSSLASLYEEPTFAERLSRQITSAVNEVLPDAVRRPLARFQS
jgi:hypothetical protein